MAHRKTIAIEDLKTLVNGRNQKSTCEPKVRQGWNSLLSDALHATGNYRGFGYLTPDKVPEGEKPGIKENRGAHPHAIGNNNVDAFEGTDETRRVYF
jgi:hypothetical protein